MKYLESHEIYLFPTCNQFSIKISYCDNNDKGFLYILPFVSFEKLNFTIFVPLYCFLSMFRPFLSKRGQVYQLLALHIKSKQLIHYDSKKDMVENQIAFPGI